MLLGGQPGWTPATLPNERLTPDTYNQIANILNTELERRELTAGVELVSTGDRLSINKYKNLLGGIERLKDDSEEVKAVYDDKKVVLPQSNKIKPGHPVSANEFAKIRSLLTAAKNESLGGSVEDHGNFVLVKPQKKIPGQGDKGVFVSGRTVKLSNYYIGKYEVTYRLWQEVYDWAKGHGYSFRSGRKGSHGDSRNTGNDPVTEVSWLDCIVWCNAYTEKEKGIGHCVYVYSDTNQVIKTTSGLTPSKVKYDQTKTGYRLPTEAEWEYAARFHGKDSTNATKYGKYDYLLNTDQFSGGCWYNSNSGGKTHPVGQKAANYAKIHDMSGNVWEWIYDGWEHPLPTGTQTNPITAASADNRVDRGGSWGLRWGVANDCVVGYRYYRGASSVDGWNGHGFGYDLGMRVACSGTVGWESKDITAVISVGEYNKLVDRLNAELKRRKEADLLEDVPQAMKISGSKVTSLDYWQFLSTLEQLVDVSEPAEEVYKQGSPTLPKSYHDLQGHDFKKAEFAKIRNMLTAAQNERLGGEVEDHGNFVLVKPQKEIVGVTPPSDRVYGNKNVWKGVFVSGRTVKLSNYYIGKYEVTYKLWKQVYDWNKNNNKGYSFRSGRKGSHGDSRNTENDPVTEVSWYDCIVWCNAYTHMKKGIEQCVYVYSDTNQVIKSTNALTPSKVKYDQSKKGYRLPTEAEWEYAARFQGRDSTNALKYNKDYLTHLDSMSGAKKNYQNHEENDRVAWYTSNSGSKTHPVGQKAANYAKIHDMSGNVWEWIYDGWEDNISTGTHTNPIGAASAGDRVIRGGCWYNYWGYAYNCVVGYRSSWWFDSRIGVVGFRLSYSQ